MKRTKQWSDGLLHSYTEYGYPVGQPDNELKLLCAAIGRRATRDEIDAQFGVGYATGYPDDDPQIIYCVDGFRHIVGSIGPGGYTPENLTENLAGKLIHICQSNNLALIQAKESI